MANEALTRELLRMLTGEKPTPAAQVGALGPALAAILGEKGLWLGAGGETKQAAWKVAEAVGKVLEEQGIQVPHEKVLRTMAKVASPGRRKILLAAAKEVVQGREFVGKESTRAVATGARRSAFGEMMKNLLADTKTKHGAAIASSREAALGKTAASKAAQGALMEELGGAAKRVAEMATKKWPAWARVPQGAAAGAAAGTTTALGKMAAGIPKVGIGGMIGTLLTMIGIPMLAGGVAGMGTEKRREETEYGLQLRKLRMLADPELQMDDTALLDEQLDMTQRLLLQRYLGGGQRGVSSEERI